MNPRTIIAVTVIAALFSVISPPTQSFGQSLFDLGDNELQVVLNYGDTSNEVHLATHEGVAEPMSLLPNQWFSLTLQFPVAKAGSTVSFGCLDGGQVSVLTSQGQFVLSANGTPPPPILHVSANGTIPLSFQAGQTLGLYRVVVELPEKRYFLHFYLVDPSRPGIGVGGVIQ